MFESKQGSLSFNPSKAFTGVRFVLYGFDSDDEQKLRSKIISGGGVDSAMNREDCTHVIVDKVVFDDPVCVRARNDGKKIVTSLWVLHSHDVGMPADTSLIIYSPVKDLNGIPTAKSLVVCLTGYQRQDRDDIMTMVGLMGAQFSKPLVANKVTHLICYKFEGEKYELAKKIKRIQLVNHQWLEDCLRSWDVIPECKYSKSGYELELMEEAKDSDDEAHEQTGLKPTSVRGANHLNLKADVLTSHVAAASKGLPNPTTPIGAAMGNNCASVRTPPLNKPINNLHYAAMDTGFYHPSITELSGHVETRNNLDSTNGDTSGFPVSSASKINPAGFSRMTSMNLARGSIEATPDRAPHPPDMWDMFDERGDDACLGLVTTPSKKFEVGIVDIDSNYPKTSEYIKSNRPDGSLMSPTGIPSLKISKPSSKKPHHIEDNSSGPNSVRDSPVSMLLKKASNLSRNLGSSCNKSGKFETYHRENGSPPRADFLMVNDTDLSKKPVTTEGSGPQPNMVNETVNLGKEQEDNGTISPIVREMEQSTSGAKIDIVNTKNDNYATVFSRKTGKKSLGSNRKLGMSKTLGKKGLVLQNGRSPSKKDNSGCSVVEKPVVVEIKGLEKTKDDNGKGRESIPDKTCKGFECSAGKNHSPENSENSVNVVELVAVEKNNEGDRYHVGDRFESNGSTEPVIVEKNPKYKTTVSGGKRSVVGEVERKTEKFKDKDSMKRKHFSANTKAWAVKNTIKEGSNKHDVEMDNQNSQNSEKKETASVLQPSVSDENARDSIRAEKENVPMVDKVLNTRKQMTIGKPVHTNTINSNKNVQTYKGCDTGGITSGQMKTTNSRKEPGLFILSGHRLQRKEFQKIIKCLKGRICRDSHQWSYQASHFIVPDPVRRTEKFFAAIASGRWVLKSDYLTASSQEGKFLEEEAFEWHKNGLSEDGTINMEAPRKWRLLRERTGHGVFHSMRVLVYGECISPPLDTLKRVVKAGEGMILATCPPYWRFLSCEGAIDYVIVKPGIPRKDEWVAEFMRHEIPCVVADYLVEYVCKPGYPLDRHVLYSTHAWAERSFQRLTKRSEEILAAVEDDVECCVCGCRDREEVMLICGDETGSSGCGVGTHIDCCDPPLESVPEGDWFCGRCCKTRDEGDGEGSGGKKMKGR